MLAPWFGERLPWALGSCLCGSLGNCRTGLCFAGHMRYAVARSLDSWFGCFNESREILVLV